MQTNRYERGLNLPSAETIVKLARILHVSTDELLIGESKDQSRPQIQIRSVKLLEKFQVLDQLPKEEQETALNILDGVIARYELNRLAERIPRHPTS